MEMDVNNTQITFIKSLVFYVLLFAPFYILLANNWLCFSILSTQPSNRTQRSRAVSDSVHYFHAHLFIYSSLHLNT